MFSALIRAALRSRAAVPDCHPFVPDLGRLRISRADHRGLSDPTDTQVNIISLYPGQPAEELERQVSIPTSARVNGTLAWSKSAASTCSACRLSR